MNLFIITPSYNQCAFLKRCVASVRDQVSDGVKPEEGSADSCELMANSSISLHHHVQDAGSTDGTVAFLQEQEANSSERSAVSYTFSYESAPDNGMYDAVCKGWRLAPEDVDVVAYLNCDEQYLPGALRLVIEWFSGHSRKDVLFGEILITSGNGEYICSRKMVSPSRYLVQMDHLPFFTAAMFIRKKALYKYDLFPDLQWRDVGDVDLVLRMMEQKVLIGMLHHYLTAFSDTGENMNLGENAVREYDLIRSSAPWWVQRLRWFWVLTHRIRKLMSGGYRLSPFDYSIYVDSLSDRRVFSVAKPESRWLSRLG